MRFRWGIFFVVMFALAACTLNSEDESVSPEPPRETPIAQATVPTATDTLEVMDTATPTAINTPEAPSTATPTETIEPIRATATTATADIVDVDKTDTPTATASITPPPSLTPSINDSPTPSATPSVTNTPGAAPTQTSVPAATSGPTNTPGRTFAPPPTFTPAIWMTQTPIATPVPTTLPPETVVVPTQESVTGSAQVCGTCGNLRLRGTPGTAGNVITYLAANALLTIIGRTVDNAWVQVTLADGSTGWVAAQYLVFSLDLDMVAVTGVAEDAAGSTSVVSGISSHARQIFLDGRAKGNSAYTFTRVGDSITASPFFLSPIASGGYDLGQYDYLGGAISFFSGPNGRGVNPFGAASIAAHNGWSTESVLNPAQADRSLCRAGETPLECEYRIVKPAVALIMFGTNDSGGLPTDQYTANLRRIVEISVGMGVIPVLSTLPPKHYDARTDGRVAEFNQIIIAIARSYDIPLWDYYSAMVVLPAEGLSSDGVHPSIPPSGTVLVLDEANLKTGYAMRNLTALQVLYALWQQVLYDGDDAIPATIPPIVYPPPGGTGDTGDDGTDDGGTTPGDCTGTLAPRLTVGNQARITPGAPNKIRSAPTLAGAQIGSIPGEGIFSVVGGPQCADGFLWWQVIYQGVTGWTANGDGTEYWVEPYP
jgi:hypothetical protein